MPKKSYPMKAKDQANMLDMPLKAGDWPEKADPKRKPKAKK